MEKYTELESRGVKPETLLEETAKALLVDGIVLRKRGGPAVSFAFYYILLKNIALIRHY